MEILLNLWDELDDLAHACRHLATSFALEAAALGRPLAVLLLTTATMPFTWLASLKNLI